MDYRKVYNSLIDRAVGRKKQRIGSEGYVYYEKHHIIPRCLGGTNEKSHLIYLTAEEHWIAHLLLVKIHPTVSSLVYACQAMSMAGGYNQRTTNKLFGWIRREYSITVSNRNTGRVVSQETRDKISKSLSGRPALHQQGENNVSKRPEVAKKISDSKKGVTRKPLLESTKQKISQANAGHKGVVGQDNPSSWRVCCVICKKETNIPAFSRGHKKCYTSIDENIAIV